VIDDDPDIVEVITSALRKNDYAVHSFKDGFSAIDDIAQKCRDQISMLITDMRMPGCSGFDVARKVRALKPDVPIILMTAFQINEIEFSQMFPSLKVDAFLQKPFTIKALLQAAKQASQY
jgi:CheY-like chemotaxis protein